MCKELHALSAPLQTGASNVVKVRLNVSHRGRWRGSCYQPVRLDVGLDRNPVTTEPGGQPEINIVQKLNLS